jgi:hypothetical protein
MSDARSRSLVLAAALVAWSCGGGDLTVPGGDPAPTSAVLMVGGDQQTAVVGARLANPLIVRLLDPAGNPLANRTVVWVVKAGGGSVDPVTSTTDAGGYASAQWTLGAAGVNTVDAQVPDVGTVTFTATATTAPGGGGAEPSATRSSIAAEPSSIVAGSASTITVTVLDAVGRPVSGATVALAATGTGNTLTQPTAVTGADGIATGTLVGSTPGERTVSATVNGSVALSRTVVVTVTQAPTTAVDHLIFSVQPPEQVKEKETFRVEVSLVDRNGAVVPLSGIFVYLGLFRDKHDHPENDKLGGERFENTVNGVATFDITVEKKGKYSLRALTDDLPELGPHGPEPYLFSRVFEVK